MKKLFSKFGSIFLLIFSMLFGGFASLTPASAVTDLDKYYQPIPDSILDSILGLDKDKLDYTPTSPSNTPSDNPYYTPIPDDILDQIIGDDGIKIDPNAPLPDDILNQIIGDDGIKIDPNQPLPDDILDQIINGGTSEDGDNSNTDTDTDNTGTDEPTTNACQDAVKGTSWIICSAFEVVSNASDSLYGVIEGFLVVEPLTTDSDSAVYRVWDYMRGFTNIVFVIFLIIVIYSQITGLGLNNYGVKRVLPRLIIAVILVNLSYLICAVLVDASNIVGEGISGLFNKVITETGLNDPSDALLAVNWVQIASALTVGGASLAIFTIGSGGIVAALFTALIVIIGVFFSVASGLLTIGLRQVVVMLLVAISPLAFVAYLLPNTEKWFDKWKAMLAQMIFFYPIFAILFNASKLAGLTIIGNSNGEILKVIIGLAVQVLPLILSVSLLKMSGTILGKVSSGLDKTFGRVAAPLQGWAASHRDLSASKYIGNRLFPGSRLRNFLAQQQLARQLHTETNLGRAKNRALNNILNKDMGFKGFDEKGKPIYRKKANNSMLAAKDAKVQADRAALAQHNYENTLSEFDKIYKDRKAKELSFQHGQTFLDIKSEFYRAENIAEADQGFVLENFMKANKSLSGYQYNRLIGRADGGLGDTGKNAIMGQVVQENANIEARRRKEALIMYNKFNYSKADFRSAMLDMAGVDDDGYELGPDGKPIEDWQYNLKPGKEHRHCQKYVAVNKKTKERISKEEYLKLNEAEKTKYDRVNYFDIYDDDGDTMARIYADDAPYIKEMFGLDIAIGDPINRRYLTEIGNPRFKSKITPLTAQYADSEKPGKLRRYHSTISSELRSSGYSEHDASCTAMILAQANSGYITNVSQRHIAMLDSIWKATKPGKFLQNDAIIMEQLAKVIDSAYSTKKGETFNDVFTEAGLALYRNVNESSLKGYRKVINANGDFEWEVIERNDPTLSVDDMREFVKHKMLPEVRKKLVGMVERTMSPNVLDSLKPDGVAALNTLAESLIKSYEIDQDPNSTIDEIGNPEINTFEKRDPNDLRRKMGYAREVISSGGKFSDLSKSEIENLTRLKIQNIRNKIAETDPLAVEDAIKEAFDGVKNINTIGNSILSLFETNPLLYDYYQEAKDIVEQNIIAPRSQSFMDTINDNSRDAEETRIANLYREITDFAANKLFSR